LADLICDTSAVIALHQVGLLHILPALAPTVVLPAAVAKAPRTCTAQRQAHGLKKLTRMTITRAAASQAIPPTQ